MFLRFANFYRQFIQSFNRMVALLTSILLSTNGSVTNKSTFADSINEVGGGQVIVEAKNKEIKIRFLILELS